jgi:hypothetical protein
MAVNTGCSGNSTAIPPPASPHGTTVNPPTTAATIRNTRRKDKHEIEATRRRNTEKNRNREEEKTQRRRRKANHRLSRSPINNCQQHLLEATASPPLFLLLRCTVSTVHWAEQVRPSPK